MKCLCIQICLLHRLIFEFFGNYDFHNCLDSTKNICIRPVSMCYNIQISCHFTTSQSHSFKSLNIIVRRRDDKTYTANYEIYDRDYLKLYLDNEIAKNVECTIPSVFFFFVK